MRNRQITRMGLFALLLTVAVWGCDDSSPTDPPTQVPAAIEVEPEQVTLSAVGEQTELVATVFDEDGEEIPDPELSFASSDEDVATVDDDGVVEAVDAGTAVITVESGEVSTEVDVTVELDG